MRKLLTLFLVLGFVAATAQAQVIEPCIDCNFTHSNRLANPSFEDVDPMGPATNAAVWNEFANLGNGDSSTRSLVMPRTGDAHMDLEVVAANGFAGVFQGLPGILSGAGGEIVTLSGWHKVLDGPVTRELKLEWHGNPQTRVDEILVPTSGLYEEFCLTAIAPAGSTGVTATYAISSFGPGQTGGRVFLDDMHLCIIPEPASMMLGLIGVMGLVGLVRRR